MYLQHKSYELEETRLEQQLLATLLTSPQKLEEQIKEWPVKPFADELHNQIWQLAKSQKEAFGAFDFNSICSSSSWTNEDINYLIDLRASYDIGGDLDLCLNLLPAFFAKRQISNLNTLSSLEASIKDVQKWGLKSKSGFAHLGSEIKAWEEDFEAKWNKEKQPCLQSGYKTLDDVSLLTNGALVVLAGLPGHGKSTMACNIALNLVQKRESVLYVSLEMPKFELMNKMLSTLSLTNLSKIRNPQNGFTGDDYAALAAAEEIFKELPLFVYDDFETSLSQIKNVIKTFIAQHPESKLVVIDYLLLIQTSGKGNRAYEIDAMTRELKLLAVELNICLLVLTQLNRSIMAQADKLPALHHLKDSSGIEQHADAVVFVHREYALDRKDAEKANEADLIVAKSRYGSPGSNKIKFYGSTGRFVEAKGWL